MKKLLASGLTAAGLCLLLTPAQPVLAQNLSEGFESVSALYADPNWSFQNNSTNATNLWRQGSAGANSIGPAPAGSPTSYALANYMDTASTATTGATISDWMITPTLTYSSGSTISFFTRTATASPFADRLEVRFSANGNSSNVGTTPDSVGDFSVLLLTINPNLATGAAGYPQSWTQYTIQGPAVSGPTSGRVAFRYFVTDAGANGQNSNIVGVDSLSIQSGAAAPEPATALLILSAVPFVYLRSRRC